MNGAINTRARGGRRRWILWLIGVLIGIVAGTGAMKTSTGPAEGNALVGSLAQGSDRPTVRFGTFNIDGGVGRDGRVDLDRTVSCLQHLDFIGLNEVHGGFRGNQAEFFAGKLHLPFLYAPAERQWWHESFGNAILTDLTVEHWERVVLPSEWLKAKRNFVVTRVNWNGTELRIVTTHSDWKSGGAEQLRIVSDVFLSLPEPAVLMGDLNATMHDAQIRRLLAMPGGEEAIEKIMGDTPGRVDWIFLRGLKTLDAGVVDLGASDHPAYWAQVVLK